MAPINRIGNDVCSLLVELEKEGCVQFSAYFTSSSATVRRLVEDLGIDCGVCSSEATGVATVRMWYPSDDGAYQDPKYVLCAVRHEMEKPDNRKKLTSALAERHFFVMIDATYWQP